MGKPTSQQPLKRARQRANPSKGADFPEKGPGSDSGPDRTANWPTPDSLGNSGKRLRGVSRVKTRMWEKG